MTSPDVLDLHFLIPAAVVPTSHGLTTLDATMPDYRRDATPGGTWFFTVVTGGREPWLHSPHAVAMLRQAITHVRRRLPFRIDAAVVLPDHLHMVWTLPPGDADFGKRWGLIKRGVGDLLCVGGNSQLPWTTSAARRHERGLWQRRFWEHRIRDDDDWRAHVDYIHYNPVKHGLVTTAVEWPHSTFHRFVARGWLPPDWASPPRVEMSGGE